MAVSVVAVVVVGIFVAMLCIVVCLWYCSVVVVLYMMRRCVDVYVAYKDQPGNLRFNVVNLLLPSVVNCQPVMLQLEGVLSLIRVI